MLIREFHIVLQKRLLESRPLIQILLGPRQVGKTMAAKAIYDAWQGPKIMVSADSPTPPRVQWIQHHWQQARLKGPGTLLILDEVQKVMGWSEQVKILFDVDREKTDLRILLLGSSSLYMQKGLRESLAGRFELVRAPHWSFSEFQQAFGWDFNQYFRFGAYPGTVPFSQDETRWRSYILDSIIEPVLGKDILGQHPVHNPALFCQTFELVVQYPAQIISLQKLLGQLQDRGNATTIKHYLELMEKSFLLLMLKKYSGSTLQSRISSPKIVILNQALTHAYHSQSRLDQEPEWYCRVFESIVGSHLSCLPNAELFYWKEGKVEVDYVIRTPDETVALEIKSGKRQQSQKGLQQFSRHYPKVRCETWDFSRCLSFLSTGKL
jgi:hypothetical protein